MRKIIVKFFVVRAWWFGFVEGFHEGMYETFVEHMKQNVDNQKLFDIYRKAADKSLARFMRARTRHEKILNH